MKEKKWKRKRKEKKGEEWSTYVKIKTIDEAKGRNETGN
jgi:hypothetical protein